MCKFNQFQHAHCQFNLKNVLDPLYSEVWALQFGASQANTDVERVLYDYAETHKTHFISCVETGSV